MPKIIYVLILCAVAGSHGKVPIPVATRQFARTVQLEQTSQTSANASLGDLDGDGDLDMVMAGLILSSAMRDSGRSST